jgi:hypothetical protein
MSRNAGQRLSNALIDALSKSLPSIAPDNFTGGESWAFGAMCRWLQAASVAEPQVLRNLFRVGNAIALKEVTDRLKKVPLYRELITAYESLMHLGLIEDYPPLFLSRDFDRLEDEELGLNTCGELWVLSLLMLPRHLRAAVAEELAAPGVSREITKAVRCPWALPMEALRETLELILQPPQQGRCSADVP